MKFKLFMTLRAQVLLMAVQKATGINCAKTFQMDFEQICNAWYHLLISSRPVISLDELLRIYRVDGKTAGGKAFVPPMAILLQRGLAAPRCTSIEGMETD